jgi:3-deoxy-D-manno-octulosonic-acid transferase
MRFIYHLGIRLYSLLIFVASPFNTKAKLFRRGRQQLFSRLQAIRPEQAPVVWFHCASLGEFEQGRPLMEAYRRQCPEHKILLTFFSPSGYEIRKHYEGADWVFYLPLDTPRNARRLIRMVRPQMAVFIKYDFWYYLLRELKKQAVPTYVVSAIFRPWQVFFKWYGAFFRTMLKAYRCLFVQDEASKQWLQSIGITNVLVTGDTRFDRVWELAQQPPQWPVVQHFCSEQFTVVAGSTWPADENRLAQALARLPDTVRLLIAPHEIDEEHLVAIEKGLARYGVVRYSSVNADSLGLLRNRRVMILDTMGMLSSVYQYGAVACIGGGFSASGIHNTLEAAVYGLPVVFGPHYRPFREACDLVAQGGAVSYTSGAELAAILQQWLTDPSVRRATGEKNRQYVVAHCGATQVILSRMSHPEKS